MNLLTKEVRSRKFCDVNWKILIKCVPLDRYFLRSFLYLYCSKPEHVLELKIVEHDPVNVLAWIALRVETDHDFLSNTGLVVSGQVIAINKQTKCGTFVQRRVRIGVI